MKRFLALCLAVMLMMSMVPAMAEEKGPLYIEGSEGVTLTYWIPLSATQSQYYDDLNDHPFYQWLEEQTGVHIEFVHPPQEQMITQFTLMMTSGNYYDLMYEAEHPDGPTAGIEDKIYVDLNEYADLMPNYQAALKSAGNEYESWEWGPEKELYGLHWKPDYLTNALTPNGELWAATAIDRYADSMPTFGCLIRQDWLDEAGLEMPETIAELEVVLEAFKQRGEDVYPMSLSETAEQVHSGAFLTMFDIYSSWYTVKPGTNEVMVAAWADDNVKDYLTLMNKWYEAGYIDPDFMNREHANSGGLDSLLLTDRLGILVDVSATPESYEAVYTGDQNFDLEPMPMPRLTEDQVLHYNGTTNEASNTCYTVMTTSCKHKEIAAQWLDRLYTYEVFMRANYGVEGESYVLEDGIPYFTDWYYNNEKYDVNTLREIYLVYGSTDWWINYSGLVSRRSNAFIGVPTMDVEKQKTEVPAQLKNGIVWGKNTDNTMAIGWVSFEGDEWGQMWDPYTEAATYADAMVLKFITGVEPIENFDKYQQKALDMGYAESLVKMQECYDKSNGIK